MKVVAPLFAVLMVLALLAITGAAAAKKMQCVDRRDNDADGLVDLADPGCAGATDDDEADPPPPPPPPPPPVTRTAIVLINFTNDQAQPYTVEQVRTIAFTGSDSVANFYTAVSYGARTVTGDVLGWWTIPLPNTPCDTAAWKAAARARAALDGIDLVEGGDYDHIALVFPRTSACPFGARVGSFYNGAYSEKALAHEVGHSFGLDHSGKYEGCVSGGVPVPWAPGCAVADAGDVWDVMGGSYRPFNGWEKVKLGYPITQATASGSGAYTLVSPAVRSLSTQVLLVPRTDGSTFVLEARESGPFDPFSPGAANGVLVRVATGPVSEQNSRTILLDMHPSTTTGTDAALRLGETYVDPLGDVSFTVTDDPTTGATVAVSLG